MRSRIASFVRPSTSTYLTMPSYSRGRNFVSASRFSYRWLSESNVVNGSSRWVTWMYSLSAIWILLGARRTARTITDFDVKFQIESGGVTEQLGELGFYTLAGHTDSPGDLLEEVRQADTLGLGAAFVSERFNFKDATTLCGAAAAA